MFAIFLVDSTTHIGNGMTGTPSGVNIAPMPMPPLDPPWLLLASIALCAMSFFLLLEAARFQKWVTAKDETAPNPWAGFGFACLLSFAMVVSSTGYWMLCHPPSFDLVGADDVFLWVIANRPSELAIGWLLASVVPSVMAIFKYVMASTIMHSADKETPALSRSPMAALVGAIFSLITLAASIVTLIMFYSRVK
jgi:hypothetical protein